MSTVTTRPARTRRWTLAKQRGTDPHRLTTKKKLFRPPLTLGVLLQSLSLALGYHNPWPARQESSSRGKINSLETFENHWRQYEEGHRRPFTHQREGEDGHNSDCEVNTKWLKDFNTINTAVLHEPCLVLNLLTIFLH